MIAPAFAPIAGGTWRLRLRCRTERGERSLDVQLAELPDRLRELAARVGVATAARMEVSR